MEDTPAGLVKASNRKRTNELHKNIDVLFQELVVDTDVTGTMSETIFVNHFLPRFIGEVEIAEDDDFLGMWIAVAGSHSSPMKIVDVKGEVLFIVPPILESTRLGGSDSTSMVSLSTIMSQYDSIARRGGNHGELFTLDVLGDFLDNTMGKKDLDATKTWLHILHRYNKLPKHTTMPNKPNESDDLLDEYD